MDDSEPVYLPGEYCEVCGGTLGLGTMTLRGEFDFTVCAWCHEDEAKLHAWLAGEMEKALEESPEYERTADGKWMHVAASAAVVEVAEEG